MTSQPWYADGLNDGEAAFIITTPDIIEHSPQDYYEMLQSHYS